MSSIRTRLTASIVVATAALAVLAVWGGLRLLEKDVRSDAVDRQAADYLDGAAELDPVGLEGFGEVVAEEILDDAFEVDIFDAFGSEAFLLDTLQTLESAELLDPIADAFADDGVFYVLLFTDRFVAVDVNDLTVREVEFDELGDDDVVVFQNELAELQLALVDLFDLDDADELGELDLDDIEEGDIGDSELLEVDLSELGERTIETTVIAGPGPDLGLVVDVTDELAAVDSLRAPLWAAAVALVLLAGAATWLLTNRALRPVGAITAQVEAISGGTLHDRVPEPGTQDEIGVLAVTMNRMLGRLEASDRAQRQFVSDASHELRTPVSVLRSEADAARAAPDSTTIDHFAAVVDTEASRLGIMIDDLLYLARTDETSGAFRNGQRPKSARTDIDLDDIVLAESARARRVPIDRSGVSAGRVQGRTDELSRVVAHLLDNAARHAHSRVAVTVASEAGQVRLLVDDDGAGVPEPDRRRIFERFVRLDEARNRDDGGSGLGLAVVAAIVEQHGGTIVVSDGPLGGARFDIRLPSADTDGAS